MGKALPRQQVLDQIHLLHGQGCAKVSPACDVAHRSRMALHNPSSHRVRDVYEHDRNRRRRTFRRKGRRGRISDDNVRFQRDKVGSKAGKALVSPFGVPVFKDEVLALDVPELPQPAQEVPGLPRGRR